MNLQRAAILNTLGNLAPLVVGVIAVPLYLHVIGAEKYGALAVLWALLGYSSMFDMGLSRAIANQIARLRLAAPETREAAFWTATILNLMVGAAGALVVLSIGGVITKALVPGSPALGLELSSAVPWLALAVPTTTMTSVIVGAIEGSEHFGLTNGIRVVSAVLFQLVPLATAYLVGDQLHLLVAAAVLSRLSMLLPLAMGAARILPLSGRLRLEWAFVRPLVSFGSWLTISNVISPILESADRLVISRLLGPASVAYYAVAFRIASATRFIPAAFSAAVFPRLSRQSQEDRSRTVRQAMTVLAAVMTPFLVLAMVLIDPFFRLWVGPSIARQAAPIARLLLLGIWANGIAYISVAKLEAEGRPRAVARLHTIELLPFLLLLVLLARSAGLFGAAAAWTIRVFVDALVLFLVAGHFRDVWRLAAGLALLVGAWLAIGLVGQDSPIGLLLSGSFLVGASYWAWLRSNRLRGYVTSLLIRSQS